MYRSPWKQNTAEVATLISEVGQLEKKTVQLGKTVQEYLSQGSFNQKYSFLLFTYYMHMHRLIYS